MTILSDVILDLTERGYSISFSPHQVFPEDVTLIKMAKNKHQRDNRVSKIELDYYKIDHNEYLCEKIKTMAAEIMQEEIDGNKYLCEKIKSIATEIMQEERGEK